MIIDELKKRMLIQKIVMFVTDRCIPAGNLGVLGWAFYGAAVGSDIIQIVIIVILIFALSIVTRFICYGIHRPKFMDSNCTSEEFNQLLLEEEIDKSLSDKFLKERRKLEAITCLSGFNGYTDEYLKHVKSVTANNIIIKENIYNIAAVLELAELNKELKKIDIEVQ